MNTITPFITFKKDGLKALEFYKNIFSDFELEHSMTMPGSDQLLHASFSLNGQAFMAMDGGDFFNFSEGISLFIACSTQNEVDEYWEKLTADGGEGGQCGWLKDRFGVSWQIIPTRLGELMGGSDPKKSGAVMQAMLKMHKINIAELESVYNDN